MYKAKAAYHAGYGTVSVWEKRCGRHEECTGSKNIFICNFDNTHTESCFGDFRGHYIDLYSFPEDLP